jgi:hypothetical protein
VLREIFTDFHHGTMDMISPLTRRGCFERYRFHDDVFAEGEAFFFRAAMKFEFQYDARPVAVARDTGRNAGKATRKNVEMTSLCLDRLERDADFPPEYRCYVDEFRGRWFRDSAWSTSPRFGPAGTWCGRGLCIVMPSRFARAKQSIPERSRGSPCAPSLGARARS